MLPDTTKAREIMSSMANPNWDIGTVDYVAHLKIERVQRTPGLGNQHSKRDKIEVTQMTVSASTLPKLISKLSKHVLIVSEEGE